MIKGNDDYDDGGGDDDDGSDSALVSSIVRWSLYRTTHSL